MLRHLFRARHLPLLLVAGVFLLGPSASAWERLRGLDEHGTTALMRASRAGQASVVRDLLDRGIFSPDPDRAVPGDDGRSFIAFLSFMQSRPSRDPGWTALHYAAAGSHADVVAVLLAAEADPNRTTRDGETALDVALTWPGAGDAEARARTTRLLVDAGGRAGRARRGAPLAAGVALAGGDTVLLRRLQEAGYDLHGADGEGHTALMVAARQNDLDAVEALLRLGADPGHRTPSGWTAGMLALRAGHGSLAARLGAVGTADGAAVRALDLVRADAAPALREMLAAGPPSDVRDEEGRGLLQVALEEASEATLLVLLDGGVTVPEGRARETLVKGTLSRGWRESTERLLALGAPLPDDAALFAVVSGRADVLALVLARGAAAKTPGNAALREALAADRPDPELVRLLLEAGADPRERGRRGVAPLDGADQLAGACARCAELLREHAARLEVEEAAGESSGSPSGGR